MILSSFISHNAAISYSVFKPQSHSAGEICAIATVEGPDFASQIARIVDAAASFAESGVAAGYQAVFARIYLSDAANQQGSAVSSIRKIFPQAAISCVQQPPMSLSKIAILLFLQEGAVVSRIDDCTSAVARNGRTQFYSASVVSDIQDTYAETCLQLGYIEKMLGSRGLSIAGNCVRTWFFVQNIDVNYDAVVRARRDNFSANGLTESTHYISSTGIGGRHASKDVTSILDAYCVDHLEDGQMTYLYASHCMNRTSDYGVTFERGTCIDYADRRHVIISGTASIDSKGAIVAEGDIVAQASRMIHNVEALLDEAGASTKDISHIVCYLRDAADCRAVDEIMRSRFPGIPCLITLAPVCRPGWLIEMECMAAVVRKSDFGQF